MKAVIDDIIDSMFSFRGNIGLVVGVSTHGRCSILGYSNEGKGNTTPPNGDTLFEIGSVTKVFTTALLSIMVSDGMINLEDPVCDLVPGLSDLPPDITLLRLATHTAGLPKMPSNILGSMFRDRRNPYAAYTTDNLLTWLSSYSRKAKPYSGEEVRYSNLGLALLGYVLAQRAGKPFEQIIINQICEPLDMLDTAITLTPAQHERLSTPHAANGKTSLNWKLPAFVGAGALFSTTNDLLHFIAANLGQLGSSLDTPLQACHTIYTDALRPPGTIERLIAGLSRDRHQNVDYRSEMALGWFVGWLQNGKSRIYWHHGATGGYRAFIGFVKDTQTGVVVLANSGPSTVDGLLSSTSTDWIGFAIMEHLNATIR
jgi:CubicO group peptidase (beta-lactamase class C family)